MNPTLITICKEKIAQYERDLVDLAKHRDTLNKLFATSKDHEEWFCVWQREELLEEEKHLNTHLTKWRYKLGEAQGKPLPKSDNYHDLDVIKQVPCESIMPTEAKRQVSGRLTYLCPFHDEKTPSFFIFTNKNTYHCFGCQVHGSVIDLFMALNNVPFKTACEELEHLV